MAKRHGTYSLDEILNKVDGEVVVADGRRYKIRSCRRGMDYDAQILDPKTPEEEKFCFIQLTGGSFGEEVNAILNACEKKAIALFEGR